VIVIVMIGLLGDEQLSTVIDGSVYWMMFRGSETKNSKNFILTALQMA
jgi:hypothetical protein